MNILTRKEQKLMLTLMCRGNGICDIVEITGHSPTTVRAHLARFGEALAATHDRLVRGVSPRRLELDELWSYVYAKREKNISTEVRKLAPPDERGEFYTWTALDPDSKLFITFHIGDRGEGTAVPFLQDLASRVLGQVLITTDGHPVYVNAIQEVFGDRADHVVIQKTIKS